MDDLRLGAVCRALRRRLGWRQSDLAERVGVSQDQVSRIERGILAGMPYQTIRNVFAALGARFDGGVSWRGGELDRLLDERHAVLVGQAAAIYRAHGWEAVADQVKSEEARKGALFYAVGVENADMKTLARFSDQRAPLKLKGLAFRELFRWLSKSLTAVAQSRPGEQAPLPPVGWAQVDTSH